MRQDRNSNIIECFEKFDLNSMNWQTNESNYSTTIFIRSKENANFNWLMLPDHGILDLKTQTQYPSIDLLEFNVTLYEDYHFFSSDYQISIV